jgi:MFS family permease
MAPSVGHEPSPPPSPSSDLVPLLHYPVFLAFWVSRLLVQIAQGALMYGLLVLVVDGTDSSFFNSLFVACAVIPAILFGLPAGVAVDALPRRPLMISLNLLRFSFILALVINAPSLAGIFATALAIWIIHQFYAPAEGSALAIIVPKSRLTEAQALSNLALVIAQGVGVILIAPLLLKTGEPRYLFAVCAALFLTATFFTMQLPKIESVMAQKAEEMRRKPVSETLLTGLRITMNDPILFRVSVADMMVGIGLSALIVIAPIYLTRIIDTSSENTVFVFAPAAVGVLIGLRAAPWLGRLMPLLMVATVGLVLFAFCIAAFGFMENIYLFLNETLNVPIDNLARTIRVPPMALLVMIFSIPAGFASSIVGVASRAVTLGRAPRSSRGQVVATQSLIQNLGALGPTLLAGIAADIIGVEQVAIMIALVIVGGAAVAFFMHRPEPATLAAPPAT